MFVKLALTMLGPRKNALLLKIIKHSEHNEILGP